MSYEAEDKNSWKKKLTNIVKGAHLKQPIKQKNKIKWQNIKDKCQRLEREEVGVSRRIRRIGSTHNKGIRIAATSIGPGWYHWAPWTIMGLTWSHRSLGPTWRHWASWWVGPTWSHLDARIEAPFTISSGPLLRPLELSLPHHTWVPRTKTPRLSCSLYVPINFIHSYYISIII